MWPKTIASPLGEEEALNSARKRVKRGDVSIYSPPIAELDGEEASDTGMPISHKRVETESLSSSEITPISTNMNSEAAENSTGEEASQINVAAKSKETKLEKVTTPKKLAIPGKETKAAKTPQNNTSTQSRVSRKRRATQRYGIDGTKLWQ